MAKKRRRSRSAPVPRIGSRALADRLGVTVRQVQRWVARGLPSRRRKSAGGGPRRHAFDEHEVKAWLISKGIAPKETAAQADAEIPADVPRVAPPAKHPAAADTSALGYEGMIERLKVAERAAFATWASAMNRKALPAVVAAYARLWLDQSEQLRKVAKDAGAIRKNAADWLLAADVESAFARVATEIRMALLAMPRSLASRLEGLGPAEIEEALQQEIHACLQLLSNPVA